MPNWILVGRAGDVAEGESHVIEAAGLHVAIFNVSGVLHAIDNACAHQGGPLGEGTIDGRTVTCPWHYWRYDVTTGRTTLSDGIGVKKYPIELRGDEIYVDVS